MRKIGVTGQNGFVGSYLYNTLGLFPNEFECVEFERSYFDSPEKLDDFVSKCDVIVHLAALNRHNDPEEIFRLNTTLVDNLIESLERTGSTPHLIISSSTQEERNNYYGLSKKIGRERLASWAEKSGAKFAGLVIPNVFGPFGHPYYNSVVATFCYQITRGEIPKIEVDGQLKLIFVGDLVTEILKVIRVGIDVARYEVIHSAEAKVSELLEILSSFKISYQENGEIPSLPSLFHHNLFNTYRCYMDIGTYFPRKFTQHIDQRGAFVELIRLGIGGQVSFSTTVPGVTRGNHFHTRKIERFAVIKGKALIQLRRIGTDLVHDFFLDGTDPAYVDMPIWYTHNIKNIGEEELLTVFWINEHYNSSDPDTFFVTV